MPTYYPRFACIKEKCRHNCCIGWEIDIDAESAARYKHEEGAFGEKIRRNIEVTDGTPHFKLAENGRCPFLTKENLCEMHIKSGEDALCQICKDHPRYRNYYSFGVEMGLGACCEAALKLILQEKKTPRFILLSGNGKKKPNETEERFFALRTHLLDMAFDASLPLHKRPGAICEEFGLQLPEKDVYSLYSGFTVLHLSWKDKIERLKTVREPLFFTFFPQLFSYFLCRHFAGGLADGRLTARLRFALHATDVILRLSMSEEEVQETARAYAEEIEYAAENTEAVLDFLS